MMKVIFVLVCMAWVSGGGTVTTRLAAYEKPQQCEQAAGRLRDKLPSFNTQYVCIPANQ